MRFAVLVKANKDSEAGVLPSRELLEEMGKFNEQLAKDGIMLAGEGLHATSKGARLRFDGGRTTVIDGPFCSSNSAASKMHETNSSGPHSSPAMRAIARCYSVAPRRVEANSSISAVRQ